MGRTRSRGFACQAGKPGLHPEGPAAPFLSWQPGAAGGIPTWDMSKIWTADHPPSVCSRERKQMLVPRNHGKPYLTGKANAAWSSLACNEIIRGLDHSLVPPACHSAPLPSHPKQMRVILFGKL